MAAQHDTPITRQQLISLLNEDLSREYQAIIAYVTYSQVLKGAQYMNSCRRRRKRYPDDPDSAHLRPTGAQ
jgi:hypothetical protein